MCQYKWNTLKWDQKFQINRRISNFLFLIWIISRHENRPIQITVQIWTFLAQGVSLTIRFIVDNYFFLQWKEKQSKIIRSLKFPKERWKKNMHIHINMNEMDLTDILLLSLFLLLYLLIYCKDSGLKLRELIFFLDKMFVTYFKCY